MRKARRRERLRACVETEKMQAEDELSRHAQEMWARAVRGVVAVQSRMRMKVARARRNAHLNEWMRHRAGQERKIKAEVMQITLLRMQVSVGLGLRCGSSW